MDNVAYKPEVPEERRDAPPSYSAISSPIGLDQLGILTRVDIRQRNITTEHGEVVFGLKRELIQKGCTTAAFVFDLYDKTGRMAIRLKPVSSCCNARLEVHVNGQYAAKLKMSSVFMPNYVVSDASGGKVLKIHTPSLGQNQNRFLLRLKDMQGNQIGSVTKKWNGLADEIFADSNELQIDFPRDLGVQYKAAVIGFCVMIIQEANVQYQYRS